MPFLDPLIPLAKEWQIFYLFCSSELSNTFQQNLLWVVGLQQFPLMCGDWRHVLRIHLADTFAGNCLWYVPYRFFTTAVFPSKVRQDVFVLGWAEYGRPPLDRTDGLKWDWRTMELDVGAIALMYTDKIKAVLLLSAKAAFKTEGVISGCWLTDVFEIRYLILRH